PRRKPWEQPKKSSSSGGAKDNLRSVSTRVHLGARNKLATGSFHRQHSPTHQSPNRTLGGNRKNRSLYRRRHARQLARPAHRLQRRRPYPAQAADLPESRVPQESDRR